MLRAEHRHSWLHTQQEGSVRGSVHSVQRHLPHRSHRSRCFFSAGEEGIRAESGGEPAWWRFCCCCCCCCCGPAGADVLLDFTSSDLEEEVEVEEDVEEVEEEEVRTLALEEDTQTGVLVLVLVMVLTELWCCC